MRCSITTSRHPSGTTNTILFFPVCGGEYFSLAGVNYLVLGDRFSGWLSISTAGQDEFDTKTL